jgi:hypothetical protein
MNYMSMVMMFYFNNQEGLIYIHSRVENHLEVYLMEDHQEEDCYLIHMFNFMDDQHLIQGCLYHHGTHWLQLDMNQPINCLIKNFNIQHMWRILILMFTSKFSTKKFIVNGEIVEANIINLFGFTLWNCISEWGKNFVQNHPNCIFEKSWNKCFANAFELWRTMKKSTCGQGTSNNKLANKWKFIMNICSNLLIVCK